MQRQPAPERFAGKVAIVTGAAGGIGAAAARRLGEEGASVLCADVQADGVEATVAAVAEAGGVALARVVDVRDSDQCRDLVEAAVARWGRLDALCNVAGVLHARHSTDETDEGWRRILAVNLDGPFFLTRAALPALLEARGAVVNVSSTAGVMGQAYMAAYCASKHGVVGMTKALAVEYARKGLRVNAVCPGGVATAMTQEIDFPSDVNWHLVMRANITDSSQPPESVAAAIAWLASDEAAYVNGAVLSVDSGVAAG